MSKSGLLKQVINICSENQTDTLKTYVDTYETYIMEPLVIYD